MYLIKRYRCIYFIYQSVIVVVLRCWIMELKAPDHPIRKLIIAIMASTAVDSAASAKIIAYISIIDRTAIR